MLEMVGTASEMEVTMLLLADAVLPLKINWTLRGARSFLRPVPLAAGPSVHSSALLETLMGSHGVPPKESTLLRRLGLKPAPLTVTVLTMLRFRLEGVIPEISS